MTWNHLLQIGLYLGVLLVLVKPLGGYTAGVYEGRSAAVRWLAPVEHSIYRITGVHPEAEMRRTEYAVAFLWFNLLGVLAVYALQRFQDVLPLNPQGLGGVRADSAFNTAISFATNTNWQGYSGETTMSDLTQMLGLAVQNFVSAAGGMAVLVALTRGFVRQNSDTIGNFWVDLTRGILHILLPLSFILSLILIGQGVVQTFDPYRTVPLLESASYEKGRNWIKTTDR